MPTQLIPVGPAVTLTQNVVYALPARQCALTSSAAVETSMNGTAWSAHTSGQNTGAIFVRSALAGTIITCKTRVLTR
jgi:hypothetical protein